MPIKVQCACGKGFAAKDELGGKTVKCPGCQQPLKIPGSGAPAGSSTAKPAASAANAAKPAATAGKAARPAAAKAPAAAALPAKLNDDLFDDLGLAPPTEGTRPCPGCTEPLAIDAVICVKCGFNTRIGRRMQTTREGGGDTVAHGAVAQDLLDRAASVLDGDVDEEHKKTHEGMPWWVYLVVLILLICLATFMLMRSGGEEEEPDPGKAAFAPTVPATYV